MVAATVPTTPKSGADVSKSKKPSGGSVPPAPTGEATPTASTGEGKSIAFRAPAGLSRRLERVAEGLGLDISNLVRMVLHEKLHEYEQRVTQLESHTPKGCDS